MKALVKKNERYIVLAILIVMVYYFSRGDLSSGWPFYAILTAATFHRTTWAALKLVLMKLGVFLAIIVGIPIGFAFYFVVFGAGKFFLSFSRHSTRGILRDKHYNFQDLKGPY